MGAAAGHHKAFFTGQVLSLLEGKLEKLIGQIIYIDGGWLSVQ